MTYMKYIGHTGSRVLWGYLDFSTFSRVSPMYIRVLRPSITRTFSHAAHGVCKRGRFLMEVLIWLNKNLSIHTHINN